MTTDLMPKVTLAGSRRTFLCTSAALLGGALLGGPAVAAAQGYTYRANQQYVIITRNGDDGKGLGLTPIQPDDIIRVPERYF